MADAERSSVGTSSSMDEVELVEGSAAKPKPKLHQL
jgi:hypothetical protein